MRDLLILGAYVLGWIITARVLFVQSSRHPGGGDGFPETMAGLVWPILLGVAVALLPIVAVGWLISRPVRSGVTQSENHRE